MIVRVDFLQDLPIPQNGAPVSRTFYANEGWDFAFLSDVRVALTHRASLRQYGTCGVPYFVTHGPPADE